MEKMKGYAESFPPAPSSRQELPALTTSAGLRRVPRQHPEGAGGGWVREPLLCRTVTSELSRAPPLARIAWELWSRVLVVINTGSLQPRYGLSTAHSDVPGGAYLSPKWCSGWGHEQKEFVPCRHVSAGMMGTVFPS